VPAFLVKLGTNDLNCVDVPLNPTHSLTFVFPSYHGSMVAAYCPPSETLSFFTALMLSVGNRKVSKPVKVKPLQVPKISHLETALTWSDLGENGPNEEKLGM